MKNGLYNFKYRGIHLSIHWTFILVIIWLFIANLITGWSGTGWIWSLIMVLSLFVSIFIHDMAQAIVGTIFGMEINRMTIMPTGGLPSLVKRPERKVYEILMLAAGPAINLGVAILLKSFLHPFQAYWDEPVNIGVAYPGNFIFQLMFINLCLGMLNLLPAFPMDGGRALDTLLEKKYSVSKAKKIVRVVSIVIAFGFLISGVIYVYYALILVGLFILFTVRMGKYYHPSNKKPDRANINKSRLQPS
jgi:Zn-dependent protease